MDDCKVAIVCTFGWLTDCRYYMSEAYWNIAKFPPTTLNPTPRHIIVIWITAEVRSILHGGIGKPRCVSVTWTPRPAGATIAGGRHIPGVFVPDADIKQLFADPLFWCKTRMEIFSIRS